MPRFQILRLKDVIYTSLTTCNKLIRAEIQLGNKSLMEMYPNNHIIFFNKLPLQKIFFMHKTVYQRL